MNKLFLIDGHSLIFRMYYAFLRRPMVNSKGVDTSILYGFMKYLLELIKREEPTHIGVAFDPPCKTFRHEIFPPYKSNRDATPELIKEVLDPLSKLVSSLGIPILMAPGYEADDVIGTLATTAAQKGFSVYMVSPDKDLGQIISDNIFQYKPGKGGGENEIIGKKEICDKFAIESPSQVIDILTLWGDSSDNVPGVRGVGEVGAKKLIGKYGTTEGILEHLSELSPKQAAAFEEAREQIPLSKLLVTIKCDVPIEFDQQSLMVHIDDSSEFLKLCEQYEFPSLLKLIPSSTLELATPEKERVEIPLIIVDRERLYQEASTEKMVGIKISNGRLHLSAGNSSDKMVFSTERFSEVRDLLEDTNISKVGYSLKEYIHILEGEGISLNGRLLDIELIHYLINPERGHKLDLLAKSYLNIDLERAYTQETRQEEVDTFDLFSQPPAEEDLSSPSLDKERVGTSILIPLYRGVEQELYSNPKLQSLYQEIEEPLIRVLSNIEKEGFKIDTPLLMEFKGELLDRMQSLQEKIREVANDPFLNISSPKQIGVLLYEKLGLNPKVKKGSSGGYPTDEETLLSIADKHSVVHDILEFRGLKKLISTYIEPFPTLINSKTGKIHTTFNQSLTATGRLSSVKPNLQNIPIRTELGREIRKAFIPSHPDGYIVSADYSQIELRVMASMSGDRGLIDAFNDGMDIHTSTAAKVFKVSPEEVTKEQRRKAKMVNFGIIYGISPFGLSQRLQISRSESKEIIEEYFKHFPEIKGYIEKVKEDARKCGYVETLYGRKRYLPEINSKNATVRNLAERNAINAPIQGSAADIIKLAMINVHNRLMAEGLKSRMILQVHDELIIDTHPEELLLVMSIVKGEMEGVSNIGVPLIVDCSYGKNWLEAH